MKVSAPKQISRVCHWILFSLFSLWSPFGRPFQCAAQIVDPYGVKSCAFYYIQFGMIKFYSFQTIKWVNRERKKKEELFIFSPLIFFLHSFGLFFVGQQQPLLIIIMKSWNLKQKHIEMKTCHWALSNHLHRLTTNKMSLKLVKFLRLTKNYFIFVKI